MVSLGKTYFECGGSTVEFEPRDWTLGGLSSIPDSHCDLGDLSGPPFLHLCHGDSLCPVGT